MLAFLGSLLWMASRRAFPQALRCFAIALLLLLPIGVYRDWRDPAYRDLDFQKYPDEFEKAPAGTKVTIPINPNWTLELTKH